MQGEAGEQLTIESWLAANPDHLGSTYSRKLDQKRLNKQTGKVFEAMKDGRWYTLAELSALTGAPEASVSARFRDLKRPEFGSWLTEKRRVPGTKGLWQYRLVLEPRP